MLKMFRQVSHQCAIYILVARKVSECCPFDVNTSECASIKVKWRLFLLCWIYEFSMSWQDGTELLHCDSFCVSRNKNSEAFVVSSNDQKFVQKVVGEMIFSL